jgi:hypothetical protein
MGEITTDEWIQDLGDDWQAAYQVDVSEGKPRIGEIRVYAAPEPQPHQRGDRLRQKRPSRPLSKELLKQIDPGKAIEILKARAENDVRLTTQIRDAMAAEPDRPGRRGRGDWWWAAIALIYLNVIRAGSKRPVVDTSKILGEHYGEHYVRDALREARDKELLTRPGRRRTSGQQLTPKGIQALVDHDEYGELAHAIRDDELVVGWPAGLDVPASARYWSHAKATARAAAAQARRREE